jgi:hypothetical protein
MSGAEVGVWVVGQVVDFVLTEKLARIREKTASK